METPSSFHDSMKVSSVLEIPSMKILRHLGVRREARYSELLGLIGSRGSLGISLKDLEEEGLVGQRVVETRPVRVYYHLTPKGARITKNLTAMEKVLKG